MLQKFHEVLEYNLKKKIRITLLWLLKINTCFQITKFSTCKKYLLKGIKTFQIFELHKIPPLLPILLTTFPLNFH